MTRQAEVVIIGGGIVGCAAAYYLARRGLAPLLLEGREVAGQQSGRNWGFVRQQGRDPLELPLMIESNRLWRGLEAELGADIEWVQGGNLALAASEERMALFEEWLGIARQVGLDTRLLRQRDLEAVAPGMHGSWVGGMYTPSDGHAEPAKATEAFARAAAARGATIQTGRMAESLLTTNGEIAGVVTDAGEIRTTRLVCAAGAWSAPLLRTVGLRLPRRLVRATVARTTPAPPITRAGVWGPAVAFRQRRDGRLNLAAGGATDYDVTLDAFRDLRRFWPNYWKNRRLFRLHVGRPIGRDLARLWPGARGRRAFPYERDARARRAPVSGSTPPGAGRRVVGGDLAQRTLRGGPAVPSANRARRKPRMSSDAFPSATSSAIRRPTIGPMAKPWPLKPVATISPLGVGASSSTGTASGITSM